MLSILNVELQQNENSNPLTTILLRNPQSLLKYVFKKKPPNYMFIELEVWQVTSITSNKSMDYYSVVKYWQFSCKMKFQFSNIMTNNISGSIMTNNWHFLRTVYGSIMQSKIQRKLATLTLQCTVFLSTITIAGQVS